MNGNASIDGFARLNDDSKLECRICWYVYDPAEGDTLSQVLPGTPFRDLPGYWRCPQCDSGPDSFIPLED